MEAFLKQILRKSWRGGLLAALLWSGAVASVRAQLVEKDSTEWVGEWRDDGNLQYAFRLKVVPVGEGKVQGVFEWKLIWTSLVEHRPKVGAVAKEYVVGRYDPATRRLTLVGMRQDDPADIISMDHYLIDIAADGKRLEGVNIKPTNYHGSMFGVKMVPKPKPKPAPSPAVVVERPMAKEKAKTGTPAAKPAPADPAAKPTAPASPSPSASIPPKRPAQDLELGEREIVTKTEIKAAATDVRIRIFDESLIDGDVVSLNWNGVWVLRYYRVSHAPKELVLKLQQGENTLVMHAENLGKYPPNTAAVSIQHGAKTQQVILNSDMGKSEAIKIVKE